jgi:hypothetical protein
MLIIKILLNNEKYQFRLIGLPHICLSAASTKYKKSQLQKEINMRNWKLSTIGALIMTLLLSSAGGLAFAAAGAPLTPELAAKKEMVRKQQEQRITPEKRKAAAEALKAERLKVYKANQDAQQSTPVSTDIK